MTTRETLQMALDALLLADRYLSGAGYSVCSSTETAIAELREALAEPSEPAYTADQIADACIEAEIPDSKYESLLMTLPITESVVRTGYTHPPVQTEPLSDEEIDEACKDIWGSDYGASLSCQMQRDIGRAVEKAIRGKL